jgi:hypothetical protein
MSTPGGSGDAQLQSRSSRSDGSALSLCGMMGEVRGDPPPRLMRTKAPSPTRIGNPTGVGRFGQARWRGGSGRRKRGVGWCGSGRSGCDEGGPCWMSACDRAMSGWAGGPQAAAEPRDLGGSGAPGAVVSGEALIERVAPGWWIVLGVPGRGRIAGEELSPPASGAAIGRVRIGTVRGRGARAWCQPRRPCTHARSGSPPCATSRWGRRRRGSGAGAPAGAESGVRAGRAVQGDRRGPRCVRRVQDAAARRSAGRPETRGAPETTRA